MPKHANAEHDEFAAAEDAVNEMSGYEATRGVPVEDQRQYVLVPRGTLVTLKVLGFEMATQNPSKPSIIARFQVVAPEKFANGSSTFSSFLSLNSVIGEGKQSSGWLMTKAQLSWIYAAANQVNSAEGCRKMVDLVMNEFPNISADDKPSFYALLVSNANDQLANATFDTKIGVQFGKAKPGQDHLPASEQEKYPDKQTLGELVYPRTSK